MIKHISLFTVHKILSNRELFLGTLHEMSEEAKLIREDYLTKMTLKRVAVSMTPFMKHKSAVFLKDYVAAFAPIEFAL